MYEKRQLNSIKHLRSLRTLFLHRPYRRMPETGLAVSYLFALGKGNAEDQAELASYCYEAGIDADTLLLEMVSQPDIPSFAEPERHQFEAYPMAMAVLRAFRASHYYRHEILDKLRLGSDTMLDLGNLYTAALPAWMAAGFEQALDENSLAAGEEVLTLGYGSGDAAEVIPFFMAENWREAAAKIHFADAMELTLDLSREQYEMLHDGQRAQGLDYVVHNEFVIDRVGVSNERQFSDLGIEYYRYIA
jgi:hydroxymethylglutaryl-CoA synthase